MGSAKKVVKKVTKAVTKPISKAFKGVAKGIMKVGKATMRGVAKLNKKLGPLGSIALAVAMPYALGGLSSIVGSPAMAGYGGSGLMGSTNTFLKAIGNVGNSIRLGYNAATGAVGKAFGSITNSIKQGFSRFAPKGSNNIFSKISSGAKNLFNRARANTKAFTKKYSPFKGKQGTVEVFDSVDPSVINMTSTDAAAAIKSGAIESSQLGKQTLGSDKWFVQGSKASDDLVTKTINDAFQVRKDTYSPDMTRYFNDRLNYEKKLGTYVNEEMTGIAAENSLGVSRLEVGTPDLDITSTIDVDLAKTGNYNVLNEEGTEFAFNGAKDYNKINAPSSSKTSKLSKAVKSSATSALKNSLLKSTKDVSPGINLAYSFGTSDGDAYQSLAGYGGTNIEGSEGGDLLKGVYSDSQINNIKTYYKHMNILGDY